MMAKKGFEIQFNWIFILVAGALILVFFSSLIAKQKNISEANLNSQALRSLESVITGVGVSLDTTNVISSTSAAISVRCGTISIGKISKQFQNMILFSPDKIQGDRMIIQTFSFDVPYRTANLVMITSPNIKYVLIGNDQIINYINKTLPNETRKESFDTYNPSQIRSSSSYKIRLITTSPSFPGSGPILGSSALAKLADSDTEAVKIISGDLNKGTAELYQKRGNHWRIINTTHYLTGSGLMGLVYSSFDLYDCSINNILERTEAVSSLYIERTEELQENYPDCNSIYRESIQKMNLIKSMEIEDFTTIGSQIRALDELNSRAKYSCKMMY